MVDFKAVMQDKYGGNSKGSGNAKKGEYTSVTDFREEMRKKYGSNQQTPSTTNLPQQPSVSVPQISNTYTQQANAGYIPPQEQHAQIRAALDEEAATLNARIAELSKIPETDDYGFKIKTDAQIAEQAGAEKRLKEIEAERATAYSADEKNRIADLEKRQKAAMNKIALANQLENDAVWSSVPTLGQNNQINKAEAQAELDKIREELSALDSSKVDYTFGERALNTIKGFGGQWASGQVNTAGTLVAGGNALQDASSAEDRAINDSMYSGWVTDDLSRANFIDAGSQSAGVLNENKEVEQKVLDYADKMAENSAASIEEAKMGLGKGGQLAVDVAGQAIQMGLDAATRMPSASMFSRSFGSGAQRARQEGATLGQQFAYGTLSAATETVTEKLFDGLAGVYGKGAADDVVRKVISKMTNSEPGQIALRMLASSGGEAIEEVIAGVLDPLYQKIYNGKSYGENFDASELLYSALIGGILGGAGGAVNPNTYRFDDTNPQSTTKPQNAPATRGDIQTPATTQEASTSQSDELNSASIAVAERQSESEANDYVSAPTNEGQAEIEFIEEILRSGRINNTTANVVLNNPQLKAQFQTITGAKLDGTTEQNRQEIRNVVRERAFSTAESERIAQETNAINEAEVKNDRDSVEALINEIVEKADTKAALAKSGYDSYIRGVLLNGATKADAVEIVNNPEARAKWEEMSGKKLPTNSPKTAIKTIMQTRRKFLDDTKAREAAEKTPQEILIEAGGGSTSTALQTDTKTDKVETAQDPIEMVRGIPESKKIDNKSVGESTNVNGVSTQLEANADGRIDTRNNIRNSEGVEESSSSFEGRPNESDSGLAVRREDGSDISAVDKAGENTDVGGHSADSFTSVGEPVNDPNLGKNVKEMPAPDKSELVVTPRSDGPKTTNEFKAQEWQKQQEQAEAKKANAESEAGSNVRSMEAPTAEDMKSVTANNNFGVYTQNVSETSKALSYRVGEMASALKDKSRKDLTSQEKRELDVARRLESLAKQVESVASGETEVSAFESYYRKLEHSKNANVRRMYFPDVAEKLSRASALLYGEETNTFKGQKAAYEAIAMLGKRVEQRTEADADVFNIMRNVGEKSKAVKESAAFKGLLKGVGKHNKSLTQELVNPSLMLKMIDGCAAHNKAEGYKLAKDEQQCNENDKIYRVEANSYFDDFIAMEGSSDFLNGKTKSHISIPLGNEESRNLSEIELVNLIKMYDSAMATRSAEDPEPDGFMVKNGKEKIFVPFNSEENEQGFSISDARLAYGKLLNDNGVVKAYNDSLVKMFDYFSGKMSDACEARNGYKLELIDEIYYPVKYASKRTGAVEDDMSFFDTLGTVKGRTREAGGFLAIGSDGSAVTNYINNAAQYAAWAEFSQRMKMLSEPNMEGDSLVSVFEGAYGAGMAEQMKSYVEDLQFKTSFKDKTFVENVAGILRKNLGTAAITLKLTTPAKQAAGTLAAGGEINLKYLLASQFGGGKKFSDVENKLLQHRGLGAIDPTIDNININGDVWWQKAVSKLPFGKKWLNAVSTADRAGIKNIYKAAAMQVCAEHGVKDLSDPKIKAEVDELFARALLGTQSDATHISNSRLYRSDNEFVKNLTLFTAQSNAQLNATLTAAMEAAAAKGTDSYDAAVKKRNAVYGAQVASSVEYALLGMLVKAALHKFKKDDEEENELMSFAAELGDGALETMASIHLMGNTAYSLFKLGAQLVGGKEPDTIYSISAGGLSSISDVISKLNRLVQTPNIRNAKNLALSVGNFTGVPLSGAYDFVNAALLWSRDVYRAFSGEEFDGDEYSDVLAFVDAELKKETIEYKDVKYEMTRKESREYRKAKESTYEEYLDYVLNMDLYKNSDAATQEKINKEIKEYANDYAKDKYLTSKGIDYVSTHDKLTSKIVIPGKKDGFKNPDIQAMPEKDIPKYLAYSAAMAEAKSNEDYNAIDELLAKYSKTLPPYQQRRFENSYKDIPGLMNAYKAGVKSKDYYTVKDSMAKQAEKLDVTSGDNMGKLMGIVNANVSQKVKDVMVEQEVGNAQYRAAYVGAKQIPGYDMNGLPDLYELILKSDPKGKPDSLSQDDLEIAFDNNPGLEYIFKEIWKSKGWEKTWEQATR